MGCQRLSGSFLHYFDGGLLVTYVPCHSSSGTTTQPKLDLAPSQAPLLMHEDLMLTERDRTKTAV